VKDAAVFLQLIRDAIGRIEAYVVLMLKDSARAR